MTCDSCVSPPSRIEEEPPSIGPYKDWLITRASETCPQNTYWSSWRQHYSVSQSMATAWSDSANLDCAITYNILLHQWDQALWGVSSLGSQEERERLRTDAFGASSLFDDLANKLQLWDKVDSRQTIPYTGAQYLSPSVNTCCSTSTSTGYICATTACFYAAVVLTTTSLSGQ